MWRPEEDEYLIVLTNFYNVVHGYIPWHVVCQLLNRSLADCIGRFLALTFPNHATHAADPKLELDSGVDATCDDITADVELMSNEDIRDLLVSDLDEKSDQLCDDLILYEDCDTLSLTSLFAD